MTKMGYSKFERTKYKIKAFSFFPQFTFWLFSGDFSWFRVGAELWEGLHQCVVTRKEGCCRPSFITPILRANTTHKPCCHTAWVAPQYAGGTLLEGGADEAEMQKNKSNHQGSMGEVFCYLLSPCIYYPQKLTGFCSGLSERH